MTCSHCVDSVKNSLIKIGGISHVDVDLATGQVQYSSNKDVQDEVEKNILSLGYKIKS